MSVHRHFRLRAAQFLLMEDLRDRLLPLLLRATFLHVVPYGYGTQSSLRIRIL